MQTSDAFLALIRGGGRNRFRDEAYLATQILFG